MAIRKVILRWMSPLGWPSKSEFVGSGISSLALNCRGKDATIGATGCRTPRSATSRLTANASIKTLKTPSPATLKNCTTSVRER